MRAIKSNVVSVPAAGNSGAPTVPANLFSRLLWSVPLLILAGFSLFGFVATFEPMPPVAQWSWRAVYLATGAGSTVASAWLWLKPRRQP